MTDTLPTLPLPLSDLPESIRKFCDPAAPAPVRGMASRGLVPAKGSDLIVMLVQLGADTDHTVAQSARDSLQKLPPGVILGACGGDIHPSILHAVAQTFAGKSETLEVLVQNRALASVTLAKIAEHCDDRVCEVIATNQQRLLENPEVIESLYKNRNARMSTVDRLVELAARNNVELKGIPSFKDHVDAIQGQLIPEPTDEPLPTDAIFSQALAEDKEDVEAIQQDAVDGTETIKDEFKPLHFKIRDMSISERIRLALIGNASARALLVRDTNKTVAHAAISSPRVTDADATAIAHSKEVSDEILRYIGNKREWLTNYELKRALVLNPKTPPGIAMKFVGHLRENDLRSLTKSRNVPASIKSAALQRLTTKGKKG